MANGTNVVPLHPGHCPEGGTSDISALIEAKDPVAQQTIMRRLTRDWIRPLEPSEFQMLAFILGATCNWGKLDRRFTYRYIEHGDNMTAGTGVSPRHARRLVTALEDKGAISVDRSDMHTLGLLIRPNLNWKPEVGMLSLPKRIKDATHTDETPADGFGRTPRTDLAGPSGHGWPDIKEDLQNISPEEPLAGSSTSSRAGGETLNFLPQSQTRKRTRPALPAKEPTPPVAATPPSKFDPAKVVAELQAKSADKADKAKLNLKPVSLEATYRAALRDGFEGSDLPLPAAWGAKERGQAKKLFEGYSQLSAEDAHECLRWVVLNWRALRSSLFGWMTRSPAPDVPHIGFLLSRRVNIVAAFVDYRTDGRIDRIEDEDTRRVAKLVRAGKSDEQARLQVAEENAVRRMREENAKAKQDASHLLRAAQIAEKQMEKKYRGRAEIHPQSETAQRLRREEAQKNFDAGSGELPDLLAALHEADAKGW